VTVASPQLIGGAQRTITDADGRYRFTSLLPGTYEVTAAHDGFKTLQRSGIDLPPGLGITVDLRLELAPVAETVTVSATAPAIDVHSSASPTILGQQLQNLPLDHDFLVFRYIGLTPGVTSATFGVPGLVVPFSLDGTDATDPERGQPRGKPSGNWIDEVQVVSLGANAEYGEYGTARINAITRSGSNRFSGLGEYWFTRPNWTGNNRGSLPSNLAQAFRPITIFGRWDASAQLGGPIVRDRLWFFGGLEYYKNEQRAASFVYGNLPESPNEPHQVTREPKYLAKLTAAPTSRLRLEGYVEYDNSKSINSNAGPLVRPEALASGQAPEWIGNTRLTWSLSDHTLLEARVGILRDHQTSGPTPPNSTAGPPGHYDTFTNVQSVNSTSFGDIWSRVIGGSASLTRYADGWGRQRHALKAGIDYQRDDHREIHGIPGNMIFFDSNGAPDTVSIGPGQTFRPSFWRTSLFVQDGWRVNDQLTIEPGVRVTSYDTSVPAQGVTFFKSTTISPRLGVAWDVSPDHRTVVRAHYGHYQHPVVGNFFDFLDPGAQVTTITAKVLGPNKFEEISRQTNTGSANDRIDPSAKHSYVQEYVAGVEREVWPRVSVTAQFVRRNFKDALGFVDVGSTWTPVAVTDPGSDGVLGTVDDGGPMTVYYNTSGQPARIFTNPPGAYGRYTAFQLIGTKRYAQGWELQASYTWSRAQSNYNNANPSTFPLFIVGNWTNPNVALFSDGRTDQDITHEVKTIGTYTLPYWGGIRVSGIYRYASGAPWARTAFFGPFTKFGGVRVEPIGTHELPATNSADLRVEKTLRIRQGGNLSVYADVFNVNNQGVATSINAGSGPNFALPTGWAAPRTLRAGIRMTY
jgi:outer membrane receptor protein involved in Fe transport